MKKCKYCQVTILDPTMVCPLCHSVLEAELDEEPGTDRNIQRSVTGNAGREADFSEEADGSVIGMYPDVKDVSRWLNFLVKLYIFLAIVAEVSLVIINYNTSHHIWWSAIAGIAILYFYITLRYSIQKNGGYLRTILIQIFGGVALTIAVDMIVGYRGWSVNFVAPSAILLLDLTIVILMLVNMENWQSYILLQILTILLGIAALILWRVGIITHPVVTIVAAAVSAAMFVGTLIFGDRRAKNELKRRFHV